MAVPPTTAPPGAARRPGPRLAAGLPAAALAFAALGIREASLGVAWPSVRTTFDQPLAALGVALFAGTTGYLLASVASGRVAGAVGHRTMVVGATVLGVVGLALVATAPAWLVFIGGLAVLGVGGGATDAGLNAVVALRDGVRGLSFVHAAFGAGAVLGPLLMALVVAGPGSWRLGYAVLLGLYVLLVPTLWRADLDAPVVATEEEAGVDVAPSRWRAALVCSVTLFFVYVGVEVCAAAWSYSLFTEERGMGEVAAGVWVAAFWAGFTLTRIATGVRGHRVHAERLLDASFLIALAGAGLFWWGPTAFAGGVGLVVMGVGFAAVFPTLVALTPRRVGPHRAHNAIGYQVGAAAVGAAAGPAAFGVLAERAGLEWLGPCLAAGIVALGLLHRLTVHLERGPA